MCSCGVTGTKGSFLAGMCAQFDMRQDMSGSERMLVCERKIQRIQTTSEKEDRLRKNGVYTTDNKRERDEGI